MAPADRSGLGGLRSGRQAVRVRPPAPLEPLVGREELLCRRLPREGLCVATGSPSARCPVAGHSASIASAKASGSRAQARPASGVMSSRRAPWFDTTTGVPHARTSGPARPNVSHGSRWGCGSRAGRAGRGSERHLQGTMRTARRVARGGRGRVGKRRPPQGSDRRARRRWDGCRSRRRAWRRTPTRRRVWRSRGSDLPSRRNGHAEPTGARFRISGPQESASPSRGGGDPTFVVGSTAVADERRSGRHCGIPSVDRAQTASNPPPDGVARVECWASSPTS
jgi:hypothetical protein